MKNQADNKPILLSKGEHYELKTGFIHKFTIGNSDMMDHKLMGNPPNRILLKAKKVGFTELIIWQKQGQSKQVYPIYVLPKDRQLKLYQLVELFQAFQLSSSVVGTHILIEGAIHSKKDYQQIIPLIKKYQESLQLNVSIDESVQKEILAEIYHFTLDEYVEYIHCQFENIGLICRYAKTNPPSKELEDFLKKNYSINFIAVNTQNQAQNYQIKLQLFQMERTDGKEFNLGLDQITGTLGEAIDGKGLDLLLKNSVALKNQNIEFSTLAQPQALIRLGHEAVLEIGQEIPFTTSTVNGTTVNWKFSGLRVQIKIEKYAQNYLAFYTTQFSKPQAQDASGAVSGNRQVSSLNLSTKHPTQLFDIGFMTVGSQESSLPYLGKIPLLGKLFTSYSGQESYKKIIGILTLEEVEHAPKK